jgi:hypothetical protein
VTLVRAARFNRPRHGPRRRFQPPSISRPCTGNFFTDEEVLRGIGVIDLRQYAIDPTADLLAFWRVDSDPKWGYKSDTNYDFKNPVFPVLPNQNTSLHVGYRWSADKTLSKDANHANVAGQYLGGLVWYGLLFRESTEDLTFVPPGLSPEFAAHLRKVAWQVVQEDSPAGKAESAQQRLPGQ